LVNYPSSFCGKHKNEAGILTGAVGLITEAAQHASGKADLVLENLLEILIWD
jgi:hypothetical protein